MTDALVQANEIGISSHLLRPGAPREPAMARRASVSSCDSKCSTCSSCSSFIDGHEQIGAYQLTKELSDGEFGQIRLGVNQNTHEKVAIKLMRKETVAAKMDKIQVEIDVLKMLDHAHIVKLYEVVETESRIGIVLEYAAGGELFDYVLDHGHVAEPQARLYFAQLIDSVRAMHELGIVHRDLKLENLLFKDVEQTHLMISDFGFANKGKDLFSTSCGSPCYAAPELVLAPGDYHGRAVDIWSCGVILYCMLCGCLPFDDDPDNPDGSNIRQLYHYIKTHTLSFPVEEQGAICLSEEAKDLLRRMLQPDPAARCTLNDVLHHSWLDDEKNRLGSVTTPVTTDSMHDDTLTGAKSGHDGALTKQEEQAKKEEPENEEEKRVTSICAPIIQDATTTVDAKDDPVHTPEPLVSPNEAPNEPLEGNQGGLTKIDEEKAKNETMDAPVLPPALPLLSQDAPAPPSPPLEDLQPADEAPLGSLPTFVAVYDATHSHDTHETDEMDGESSTHRKDILLHPLPPLPPILDASEDDQRSIHTASSVSVTRPGPRSRQPSLRRQKKFHPDRDAAPSVPVAAADPVPEPELATDSTKHLTTDENYGFHDTLLRHDDELAMLHRDTCSEDGSQKEELDEGNVMDHWQDHAQDTVRRIVPESDVPPPMDANGQRERVSVDLSREPDGRVQQLRSSSLPLLQQRDDQFAVNTTKPKQVPAKKKKPRQRRRLTSLLQHFHQHQQQQEKEQQENDGYGDDIEHDTHVHRHASLPMLRKKKNARHSTDSEGLPSISRKKTMTATVREWIRRHTTIRHAPPSPPTTSSSVNVSATGHARPQTSSSVSFAIPAQRDDELPSPSTEKRVATEQPSSIRTITHVTAQSLTSMPPSKSILALIRLLSALGLQVEHSSAYRLDCSRRAANMGMDQHQDSNNVTTPTTASSLLINDPSITIYGPPHLDAGHLVTFAIDICQSTLADLYVLDFQLVNGDTPSFEFLKTKVLALFTMVQ